MKYLLIILSLSFLIGCKTIRNNVNECWSPTPTVIFHPLELRFEYIGEDEEEDDE